MTPGRIIGLIVCLALLYVTGNKLHKMAVIKGWIDGGKVVKKTITDKTTTVGTRSDAYWIAFDNQPASQIGDHRLNLQYESWSKLRKGDEIEVIYVGNDTSPYLRDGIFVSDDNFVFDLFLLGAELTGIIACLWPLIVKPFRRGVQNK